MDLPISQAVSLCNHALNQLSPGQLAEICFFTGLKVDFKLEPLAERNPDNG